MPNEGPILEQEDKEKQAQRMFSEIIAKYPETQIAVGVNQRLLNKEILDKALVEVLTNRRLEIIRMALDAFRLDIGRYPTTAEGLDVLLGKKSNEDNWKGPYLPMPCKSFLGDFRYVEDQDQVFRLDKLK